MILAIWLLSTIPEEDDVYFRYSNNDKNFHSGTAKLAIFVAIFLFGLEFSLLGYIGLMDDMKPQNLAKILGIIAFILTYIKSLISNEHISAGDELSIFLTVTTYMFATFSVMQLVDYFIESSLNFGIHFVAIAYGQLLVYVISITNFLVKLEIL